MFSQFADDRHELDTLEPMGGYQDLLSVGRDRDVGSISKTMLVVNWHSNMNTNRLSLCSDPAASSAPRRFSSRVDASDRVNRCTAAWCHVRQLLETVRHCPCLLILDINVRERFV